MRDKLKLAIERCKKLYEISRNSGDLEWSKLYPQQQTALRVHYQKVLQMMIDEPRLYRRSNLTIVEDIIDEVLSEAKKSEIVASK